MPFRPFKIEDRVKIENPLSSMSDEEVRIDATRFVNSRAPFLSDRVDEVRRAALVAKHIRYYECIARGEAPIGVPPVILNNDEKEALVREKTKIISERGMWYVFITVSLAAFLQGFVQSSFSGANVYDGYWRTVSETHTNDHAMGITNGIAYLSAALIGCPLSDPVNQIAGRRGAIFIASVLIAVSSIAAASLPRHDFDENGGGRSTAWKTLVGLRLINGVGMGIKAVSTPILASETAIGYWRGSALLAWQLWVALGIMVSSAFNLIFYNASDPLIALRLTLASPMVPAIFLAISLYFTPESPRFYLRPYRGNYKPEIAYRELKKLRNTELQVLRDLYLVHRSVDFTNTELTPDPKVENKGGAAETEVTAKPKMSVRLNQYFSRYRDLFVNHRLRNSTISSCTVALGQQLCGINIFAFYSSTLFLNVDGGLEYPGVLEDNKQRWLKALLYSFGFGLANFLFGIPAVGTIDTFGRRKWLLVTIPGMAFALLAAALSFQSPVAAVRRNLALAFMIVQTIFYSPAMGPVPFTLASEAFPLSHRENGCSVAIMVNLFFAGIVAWFLPIIDRPLGGSGHRGGGVLGLFSAFNVVAFVLVYFLVEETKQRSLEDLEQIYNVSKRKFAKFQATEHLPWFLKRWFLCYKGERPEFYDDTTNNVTAPEAEVEEVWADARPGSASRYA
ncbi:related to myo-inositol transport protein ITR1 [Cephalotrichum gorgonifer]|uniref:Related to myo-inositol transport protein ITR1 n=1 Tax=Cephalotrichum gorgonifer TaxID=2041049 RepID=A0AAE8N5L4_9PEZI|nr:related to myo-inositol transport protein ITR1 [Cephalotrichum gorgonifer]